MSNDMRAEIAMALEYAGLKRDMASAQRVVGDGMGEMVRSAEFAKAAFGALAGALSVAAFTAMVKGVLDAQAGLHDLAAATGASVAALGQFKAVGAYTETSLDSISGAMNKLSKNMATADEDSKGAALAIKALGINFDDFRKMAPEERMLAVAKAMNDYKDGADKTAAAQALFGKEGAKLLPFLKDLGEQADQVTAKLTDQEVALRATQAAMSDAFGDNLTAISKASQGWQKDLANGLLPALYEASEAVKSMTGGTGGLKAQISALAADGSLADWARGAMTAFSYLIDVVQGLFTLLPMLGKTIAGIAAATSTSFGAIFDAIDKLKSGDVSGAWASLKDGFEGVKTVGTETADDISKLWNQKLIGATFRDTMKGLQGVGIQAKEVKKDLDLKSVLEANEAARLAEADAIKRAAEEQKRATAEYEKAVKAGEALMANIAQRNSGLAMEFDLGRALTPVEKELIKLDEDLKNGRILLTAEEERGTRAAIAYGQELEQGIATQRAMTAERAAALAALEKHAAALTDQAQKQQDENIALVLGKEGLEAMATARLLQERSLMAGMVAQEEYTGLCTAETEAHRATLQALDDLIDARNNGVHLKAAKEAADAWARTAESIGQGLTDALSKAFESGKDFFSTLWDGIKKTFASTTMKLLISPVQQGLTNIVSGLIGGTQPAYAGGQLYGTASGMGSLYSMGSSIYGLGNAAYSGLMGGGFMAAGSNAAVYGGSAYGTTFGSAQSAMLASQEAGMVSEAGLSGMSSALSSTGWLALIIAGTIRAMGDYQQGYNTAGARDVGRETGGLSGTFEGLQSGLLKTLGFNDQWASILSGSTAVAKIIGHGAPRVEGRNIVGSIGGTGFNGSFDERIREPGGYLSSDKVYTVSSALSGDIEKALNDMAGKLRAQAKVYGDALGLPVDQLDRVTQAINVDVTYSDAAESAKRIETAMKTYSDSLFGSFDAVIEPFKHAGETVEQTLQRLVILRNFSEELNNFGGIFSRIAQLSVSAKEELIGFAGGIDALIAKTRSFVGNYYSPQEQAALQARSLLSQVKSLGIDPASLGGLADLRAQVEGTDVSTTEGRQRLNSMLDLAQAFAPVGQYLQQANSVDGAKPMTLASLAGMAPANAVLAGLLSEQVGTGQATVDGLVTVADNVTSIGDQITNAVETGLAAVKSAADAQLALFKRWDDGDALNVTVVT